MNASGTRDISAPGLHARIRRVLKEHARLRRDVEQLSEHDDLYEAGMSPHFSANVMLALESEFELEFPEQMLNRSLFESIGSIACAIELTGVAGAEDTDGQSPLRAPVTTSRSYLG